MGLEIFFLLGALILLTALVFGVLSVRTRSRAAAQAGEDVVRKRYRNDQT
jgi:hypothetical protein